MDNRLKYIVFIVLLLNLMAKAQSPFFVFLSGWKGISVIEDNGQIKTISNYQEFIDGVNNAWLKVQNLDNNGTINSTWNLKTDSSWFEDAIGYNIASLSSDNKWIGTNYSTSTSGKTYQNIYRFSNEMDTTIKSISVNLTTNNENSLLEGIKYYSDSNIIIGGTSSNLNNGTFVRIANLDTAGNTIWLTDISSLSPHQSTTMSFYDICKTSDNGYFVSCFEKPYISGIGNNNQFYLLTKLDSNGSVKWKKRIDNGYHVSSPGSVIEKDSNSYLITWDEKWLQEFPGGAINNISFRDSASVWVGEINLQGDFIWKNSFYNYSSNCDTITSNSFYIPYKILSLNDGNFVIAVNNFMNDATLIKVSPDGKAIWNRSISILENQNSDASQAWLNINSIIESIDGGFLGVGEYKSSASNMFPNGIHSSVLIKLNQYGCINDECQKKGSIDSKAINYNPEATYNCGCQYKLCPESNKISIDVRHFKDMYLFDFELKKISDYGEEVMIRHDGGETLNEIKYNRNICTSKEDCRYSLSLNYKRTVPSNVSMPFASISPYDLGYLGYFKLSLNDTILLDIGTNIYAGRDTVINLQICPSTNKDSSSVSNIYPNPIYNNFSYVVPKSFDLKSGGTLKVFNMLGQEIISKKVYQSITVIELPQILSGVYTVILYNEHKKILSVSKITKQ